MFSEDGSLLLDPQVPSSPQLSAGNFFFALDGRFDRVGIWP
jgi:transcriptional regulator of aromatic amino acid metabolism